MDFAPLAFGSTLDQYTQQAADLFDAWKAGDPNAIKILHENLPRFLDDKVVWLPKQIPDSEIQAAQLDLADAKLALARRYSFRDWAALSEWVEAVRQPDSVVGRFESAVEAVIHGDAAALERLLRDDPSLIQARSTIVTHHDPPLHRATLLHYIAANGVEGYRQKSPKNAVEIATILLRAGADPDALAGMYGGDCTTMSMLVSSCHPADAGVQVDLVETLVDFGASVNENGSGNWTSPLMTALVFGYRPAAEALVRRGARIDNVAAAAGLGLVEETRQLLPAADAESRHRAMALATLNGRVETVRMLLDAGEDPNRYNPEGCHAHGTPVHHAACAGHLDVVRLLVERGARLDIRDKLWHGTPLGWAEHCKQPEIADYLRPLTVKTDSAKD